MATIRIFSKKAFALGPGAIRGTDVIEQFVTVPYAFQDMPEQYQNDNMFKLAVKSGDIEIVNTPPVVSVPKVEKEEAPEEKLPTVDEYKELVRGMNKDKVREEAGKYGAEFIEDDQLKMNKKRLLEAFKAYTEVE